MPKELQTAIEEEWNKSPKLGKAFKDLSIILQSRTTKEKADEAVNEHEDNIKSFLLAKLQLAYQAGQAAMKKKAIGVVPFPDTTDSFTAASGWNACREAVIKALNALPITEVLK